MHVQREREGEGVRAEREPPRNERERRAREYLSTKLSEEESTRTSPPRILRLHVLRTLSEVAQSRRKIWFVCVSQGRDTAGHTYTQSHKCTQMSEREKEREREREKEREKEREGKRKRERERDRER